MSRITFLAVAFAVIGVFAILLGWDWWSAMPDSVAASYVGSQRCAACHSAEWNAWRGSHHDLAMDHATPATVLGNFDNVQLVHHGETSRMFRRDDKFFVVTEGPDGRPQEFEVKFVFGVDPLQQYLVELAPAADGQDGLGQLQCLRISWDVRRGEWFYLDPPDVHEKLEIDDPLHWTGYGQNWNHMCAYCHSTNLRKGFDVDTHQYATTFSEIDVSCEACHGPGSVHIALADARSLFWDRIRGKGLPSLTNATASEQIQVCAPCHSRREPVYPGFRPGENYHDFFVNNLLEPATYYPDGQIRDEVYVFGSYTQSKMFAQEVRCTDCHQPHTLKLKHEGNTLCTSCHQHTPAKYDSPGHHHHPAGSTGTQCVECHMPATPYMEIDLRRDHKMQIPNPTMSRSLGTPNACAMCHVDASRLPEAKGQSLHYYADWLAAARNGDQDVAAELDRVNAWAEEQLATWRNKGQSPPSTSMAFAEVFARAWGGRTDSSTLKDLTTLARDRALPAIIRASAVNAIGRFPLEAIQPALRTACRDPDAQVRAAAADVLRFAPDASKKILIPLLSDNVRSVRILAARALAGVSSRWFRSSDLDARRRALAELEQGLQEDSDQAGTHMARALWAEQERRWDVAAAAYRRAIQVQPLATGPRSNLAALLENVGQLDEARQLRDDELTLLTRDARLAPENADVVYRYGMALYLAGRTEAAERQVQKVVQLEPEAPRGRLFLALLYEQQQRWLDASEQARSLVELEPDNETYQQLLARLRQMAPR